MFSIYFAQESSCILERKLKHMILGLFLIAHELKKLAPAWLESHLFSIMKLGKAQKMNLTGV
jgi:hypothetical protein